LKHPALTRVFAIVLAVLCLVMLLAGLLGLRSADRDRLRAMDDAARLRDRALQYAAALSALEGGVPYQQANETYERHQSEHDRLVSKHRSEMAIYTATQSGIRSGAYAMDQADAAFAAGKRQYEAGLAEFNKQAAAFEAQAAQFYNGKQQLENFASLYYTAAGILNNAQGLAASARGIADLMESDDPDARLQVTLAAYDSLLNAADLAAALPQTVKDMIPTLDAIAAMDAGSLDSLTQLGELGDLGGTGVQMPAVDMGQVQQIKAAYDQVWPQVKNMILEMDGLIPAIDSAAQGATGMTLAEIRAQAQAERDAVAAGGAEGLSEEQFETARAIYNASRGQIWGALGAADALLGQLQGISGQIGGVIGAAQAQLAQAETLLAQGRAAIEQARAALEEAGRQIADGEKQLYDARAMIWWQMGQQREKAARLQYEKERLDVEAVQLRDTAAAVEARKDLEQSERSLRLMLLKREEVEERSEAGMELSEAAVLTAGELEDEALRIWKGRSLAYLLLIAGGVLGFVGLPAAFERTKSRFLLLAPVLLCLLCAAAAEAVCLYLGRGSSYSAIGAGIFALIQLLVSAPKKKA
jgi:putative ABC transport system permease protein